MAREIVDERIRGKFRAAGISPPSGDGLAKRLRHPFPPIFRAHIDTLEEQDWRCLASVDVIVSQCRFGKTDNMILSIDRHEGNTVFIGAKQRQLRAVMFDRIAGPKRHAQAHPILQMLVPRLRYPHVSASLPTICHRRTEKFRFRLHNHRATYLAYSCAIFR